MAIEAPDKTVCCFVDAMTAAGSGIRKLKPELITVSLPLHLNTRAQTRPQFRYAMP
jgi:hypothetical protein